MQTATNKNWNFKHLTKANMTKIVVFTAIASLAIILAICLSSPAFAQTVTLDLGGGEEAGSTTGRIIQLLLLTTILSLAPSILIMVTSFTRIVIVFSVMRHAMGTNTSPPNMVIVSLALFMTFFIMQPTFEKSWEQGIVPLMENELEEKQAIELAAEPFHEFMINNVRDKDLSLFMRIVEEAKTVNVDADENKNEGETKASDSENKTDETSYSPEEIPYRALIPAFMISELRRAFEIGFLIYVPFIIVDMVIASILMSMGMMMLPPTMLAMPFKLIFFVLVDGWYLLTGSLIQSFN